FLHICRNSRFSRRFAEKACIFAGFQRFSIRQADPASQARPNLYPMPPAPELKNILSLYL
ncbi:hypothetical protein, partial [Paenibacillus alba]